MNLCWQKILVMPVLTFFFCTSFSYIQDILKWTLANKSIHNIISENFLQRKGPIECGWGYDNQNAFKKFLNRPEFSLFCFAQPLLFVKLTEYLKWSHHFEIKFIANPPKYTQLLRWPSLYTDEGFFSALDVSRVALATRRPTSVFRSTTTQHIDVLYFSVIEIEIEIQISKSERSSGWAIN